MAKKRERRDTPHEFGPKAPSNADVELRHPASQPKPPAMRQLRGYAFDPSLATSLATAVVSEICYSIPWERLEPGPVGEYIEVVDIDPASGCFYWPVDLDSPELLAQNGHAPSEGNPQFHQQMVYAVAMTTIDRFERALGRKAFWSDRTEGLDSERWEERYVPRLRIYPHALRMPNAYYSRAKSAVLLGYFPASDDPTTGQFPSGMVFTCLSHDIIAHEVTHALLDGFHEHFLEATNHDVLAFHEAFSDIVALFQHFTFSEVLEHQISRTRGDLAGENYLSQLATQFGHARGHRGALRDAIGGYDSAQKKWVRHTPDPTELNRTTEVHERGAILVAAVFDAFLSIYSTRTRDLLRLATNGTGVLPQGDLHPDLVSRLAGEAAKAAGHVLNMCIRALDYCPPVDLTFGEYLRALITADMDIMPEDRHGYRVAFVEAFRRRGIYPSDIRTLSEDSLRWAKPEEDPLLQPGEMEQTLSDFINAIGLRVEIDKLRYLKSRRSIWHKTREVRQTLHRGIRERVQKASVLQQITGLALVDVNVPDGVKMRNDAPVFAVSAIREARRQKEDGRVLNQVFVTILQEQQFDHDGESHTIRCGSTLVIDLDDLKVTYVIRKGLRDKKRFSNMVRYSESRPQSLAGTYFGKINEPFAELHMAAE